MTNEDLHLRQRDIEAQERQTVRIMQAKLNADEWDRRARAAIRRGDYILAVNLIKQADEEWRRHGH